ncbi:MAG: asparagine synthase (glutamine-hydrolyzing), partial [Acidobacteria bacterium]|nr:asparagine synthase (glutamine-hydrolyzing) [Acidobacteriota bacterium]
MCGIFGIITKKPRAEVTEAVTLATQTLAHRGPDDHGIEFICDARAGVTAAFSHHRLAILDLSHAGHQPMCDGVTGNWITYNGEVFNFRDVRKKLEQRGVSFHSESDTEVLLKGYGMLGHAAIADWRGMFALGFWNARERELSLVRDRFGIKPIYYYRDDANFIFASEVRSLLATGFVPRKLSRATLESYLAYGSVQQPLTIIENIYAVLPGHILKYKDGKITENPYWELCADFIPQQNGDEDEISEEISELLLEAVRLRLVSDVPVGVFLSGGIDSSSVVALMRRATTTEIKSFSVYFKEQDFSEQLYAEQVARHYGTDHSSILVTEDEILARLPAALRAMDQPSIDGINTYVVSEATARAGLKVAVSGLGGDEVFAGYGFFRTVARDEQLRLKVKNVPAGLRRAAATAINTLATSHRAHKLTSLLR